MSYQRHQGFIFNTLVTVYKNFNKIILIILSKTTKLNLNKTFKYLNPKLTPNKILKQLCSDSVVFDWLELSRQDFSNNIISVKIKPLSLHI